MPDINGNYLGDQAGVLPDNSPNILHMADQFAQFNRQKELRKQQEKVANDKRTEDYYKVVGTTFDPSKVESDNPYAANTIKDITDTRQKYIKMISDASKSKKPVDEGQLYAGITEDMGRITGNDKHAQQKYQQIKDAVASIKGPGIDDQKLLGLGKKEGFFSTDPTTGKVDMTPSRWDKNETGADVVKKVLEKYPALVGNNQGVDEALADKMKKSEGTEYKVPPVVDPITGMQKAAGFALKLKPYQEVTNDANGNPAGIDIKQAPVYLPNGKPLLNPDGTQKRTIDPQVEHQYLQDHLGFALSVKTQLNEAIGQENQHRKEINANLVRQGQAPTLSMVTGDSEEAKVMNSDIVLNRLRSINQGGKLDIEASKDFENRRKIMQDARDNERLKLAQLKDDRAAEKFNALVAGKNVVETKDLYSEISNQAGTAAPNSAGKALTTLSATSQTLLVDMAQKITGDKSINQADLVTKKNKAGEVELWKFKEKEGATNLITTLDYNDANAGKANPSVKERQTVLQKAKSFIKSTIAPKAAKASTPILTGNVR